MTLQSYDPSTAPPEEHIPNDKLTVTIRVVDGVGKPIEQWLADSRNDSGQPPVVVLSNSDITLGGKAGVAEVLDDGGDKVAGYYVEMGATDS